MKGIVGLRLFFRKKLIDSNYAHNKRAMEKHLLVIKACDGYIENQNDYTDIRYGAFGLNYNGCGVIAVYNALNYLGVTQSGGQGSVELPNLISIFENRGIVMSGEFGTAPGAIYDFFKRLGYSCIREKNAGSFSLTMRHSDVGIIIIINNRNRITDGLHTMCITRDASGGFVLHNTHGTFARYETMSELIASSGVRGQAEGLLLIGVSNVNG
jgi:hypothetical protein